MISNGEKKVVGRGHNYGTVKPHLMHCSIIDIRPYMVPHSVKPNQIQFILQASGHTIYALYIYGER